MTVFADNEGLLHRFRGGDRDALSTVYWHYVGPVEAVLRRCLAAAASGSVAGGSADLADMVQEVFVKAFSVKGREGYDASRPYKPYLLSIARNAAVDHLRARPREVHLDPETLDGLFSDDAPSADDARPWADDETIVLVDRYIASLRMEERAVYQERYERCQSQEHTAALLGLTRQQVRTLESRLRTGLARELSRSRLAAQSTRVRVAFSEKRVDP
jgi:RNA polymerase sigma factor (sigma-70 family)